MAAKTVSTWLLLSLAALCAVDCALAQPGGSVTWYSYGVSRRFVTHRVFDVGLMLPYVWLEPNISLFTWRRFYEDYSFAAQTLNGNWVEKEAAGLDLERWVPFGLRFYPLCAFEESQGRLHQSLQLGVRYWPPTKLRIADSHDSLCIVNGRGSLLEVSAAYNVEGVVTLRAGWDRLSIEERLVPLAGNSAYAAIRTPVGQIDRYSLGLEIGFASTFLPGSDLDGRSAGFFKLTVPPIIAPTMPDRIHWWRSTRNAGRIAAALGRDMDKSTTIEAILALGDLRDPKTVDALRTQLRTGDSVASEAAYALARFGPAAKPAIVDLIQTFPRTDRGRSVEDTEYLFADVPSTYRQGRKIIKGQTFTSTYSWSVSGVAQRPVSYTNREPDRVYETFFLGAYALHRITGEDFGCDRLAWERWWDDNKPKSP